VLPIQIGRFQSGIIVLDRVILTYEKILIMNEIEKQKWKYDNNITYTEHGAVFIDSKFLPHKFEEHFTYEDYENYFKSNGSTYLFVNNFIYLNYDNKKNISEIRILDGYNLEFDDEGYPIIAKLIHEDHYPFIKIFIEYEDFERELFNKYNTDLFREEKIHHFKINSKKMVLANLGIAPLDRSNIVDTYDKIYECPNGTYDVYKMDIGYQTCGYTIRKN